MIFAHSYCIGVNRMSIELFSNGGKLTSSVCQVLSLIKSLAEFSSLGGGVACACRDDRFFLLEPRTCQIPVIATPLSGVLRVASRV
jgi:hypothetical protein